MQWTIMRETHKKFVDCSLSIGGDACIIFWKFPPDVMAEWLKLVLHIQKVWGLISAWRQDILRFLVIFLSR
jgi:hypothetical protein